MALALAWFVRGATPFYQDLTRKIEDDASAVIPGAGEMAALAEWARGEAEASTSRAPSTPRSRAPQDAPP